MAPSLKPSFVKNGRGAAVTQSFGCPPRTPEACARRRCWGGLRTPTEPSRPRNHTREGQGELRGRGLPSIHVLPVPLTPGTRQGDRDSQRDHPPQLSHLVFFFFFPVFVPIYPELFTRRCVFKKRGGKVPRGGPWRYSPAGSAPRTPSLTFISRPDWGRTRVGEKKGAASEAVPPRFPPPSPLPPPETRGGGAGELPPPRVPALSGPGLGTKEGERRCCRC